MRFRPKRRHSSPRVEALVARHLLSRFTVVTTDDNGPGSLRQAILDANATPNVDGADVIDFAIPGDGRQTISIAYISPLPSIDEAVLIDGTTQPGSSVNTAASGTNAVVNIELQYGLPCGQRPYGPILWSEGEDVQDHRVGGSAIVRSVM